MIAGVWFSAGVTHPNWRGFVDHEEVNTVIPGHAFAQKMQAMVTRNISGCAMPRYRTSDRRRRNSFLTTA